MLETIQTPQSGKQTQHLFNLVPSARPPLPDAHFSPLKLGEASFSRSKSSKMRINREWRGGVCSGPRRGVQKRDVSLEAVQGSGGGGRLQHCVHTDQFKEPTSSRMLPGDRVHWHCFPVLVSSFYFLTDVSCLN